MNWANNTCIPTTLEYSCVCQDGSTPNLALYMDTIPYHICETYVAQCVQNQTGPGGSAAAQHACQTNNVCGSLDPAKATFTSSSSSSSMLSTASATGSAATGSA